MDIYKEHIQNNFLSWQQRSVSLTSLQTEQFFSICELSRQYVNVWNFIAWYFLVHLQWENIDHKFTWNSETNAENSHLEVLQVLYNAKKSETEYKAYQNLWPPP